MNRALLLVATTALALAGCKPEPAADSAPSAQAALPAAAPKADEWAFGMGRNSVEMVHLPTGDPEKPDLRMVCALGDGFLILLPDLKTGDDAPLTIAAGGATQALVATAGARHGVQATAAIAEPLMRIIEGDIALRVDHGAQSVGPVTPPPPAMRRAFTDICRKLNRQGQI